MVFSMTGFLHGVRDFQMDAPAVFVIVADMSVIGRIDAYMTNMKFPWEAEQGDPTHIPVGVTECWL